MVAQVQYKSERRHVLTKDERKFIEIIRMNPKKKQLIVSMLIKKLRKTGLLMTGSELERKLEGKIK